MAKVELIIPPLPRGLTVRATDWHSDWNSEAGSPAALVVALLTSHHRKVQDARIVHSDRRSNVAILAQIPVPAVINLNSCRVAVVILVLISLSRCCLDSRTASISISTTVYARLPRVWMDLHQFQRTGITRPDLTGVRGCPSLLPNPGLDTRLPLTSRSKVLNIRQSWNAHSHTVEC